MKTARYSLPGLAAQVATLWIAGGLSYLVNKDTPIGILSGKAVMRENGRPVPGAHITVQGVSNGQWKETRTDERGRFRIWHLPVGEYRLEARGEVHGLPTARRVEVREGNQTKEFLRLERRAYALDLSLDQQVCLPGEKLKARVGGFAPVDKLSLEIRRFNLDSFVQSASHWPPIPADWDRSSTVVRQWTAPVGKKSAEGTFARKISLPTTEPGVYRFRAAAEEVRATEMFTVTRLGLIAKADATQVLASAVDLKSGDPLPGSELCVFANRSLQGQGTTDASGLAHFAQGLKNGSQVVVAGRHESSVAFATGYFYSPEQERVRAYLYTDRPVYRPGQKVYYKGIVRDLRPGGGFNIPADQPVALEIRDSNGHRLKKESLRTSEFGSFHGEVELPAEAATGFYSITGKMGGRHLSGDFEVSEYRKPEYEVKVETEKKRYVRGERVRATVSARYFFGSPVQNADVQWSVYAQEAYLYAEEENEFGYVYEEMEEESYGYGEVVAEGLAKTDHQGCCRLEIPTTGKELPEADLNFAISVTVTDASRKPATGEGSTLVTRGDFYLRLRTDQWVYRPKQAVKVEILAKDYDGKPVPKVAVQLRCLKYLDHHERTVWPERPETVTTDDKGKAKADFPAPKNGDYVLRAEATDSGGRKLEAEHGVWVASESFYEPEYKYPDLEILLDKKVYEENDTARLLVNTTAADTTALLTVGGTKTFEWKPVRLKKGTNLVRLPIRPEWVPNVFVGISLESGKHSITREVPMRVSPKEHVLKVGVTSDRQVYRPGDKATYQVRTLDAHGKPVQAEVSLGVVDESIYAIRPDHPEEIVSRFYRICWNQVRTFTSFPEVQLGGDGKEAGPPVRKYFPDTALWLPSVITDSEGRATVEMTVPDTLGAWRATAKAQTLATAVGATIQKVTCRKDLMVRLEAPRFFTQEDTTTLSAVVHNETGKPQKVQVSLATKGLTLVDAEPQGLEVPPTNMARADWQVTAKGTGEATVTVRARAVSGLSDAMELTFPVLDHGIRQGTAMNGVVKEQVTKVVAVPSGAHLPATEVRVRLTPSLLSGLMGSLKYLAGYPYGCIEQTMSRFLPDVIVHRALERAGQRNAELEEELPKMVRDGLARIYSMQADDGGWGWTEYISSEPWMTAYVVYGLTRAKEAGFDVEQPVIDRGRSCLKRLLKENNWPDEVAYGYYVLARTGPPTANFASQRAFLTTNLKKLSNWGLACFALALCAQGNQPDAVPLLDRLMARRVEVGRSCHWNGPGSWTNYHSDVETTAAVMQLLVKVRPSDPVLPAVVHWFLTQRQQDHWISTKDTAVAIDALLDYVEKTKELTPECAVTVRWNGQTVLSRSYSAEDIGKPESLVRLRGAEVKHGDNQLEILKQGEGRFYYSVGLNYLLKEENIQPASSGITVERTLEKVESRVNKKTGLPELVSLGVATECRSGDLVRMQVKLKAQKSCEYVVVECPLPAGCEVMERRPDRSMEEWDYWWSDLTIRDEKVAFLLRYLEPGEQTLSAVLRAEIPGDFHVLPVTASCMYLPEVSGRSGEARIKLAD